MSNSKNENAIKALEQEIQKIDSKDFKIYFYVFDTKGTPSGSLAYLYDTALQLKELGYDVRMIQSEKDFVGVGSWLGKEYAELPHLNAEKDLLSLSTSDIIFIPELNANVMLALKNNHVTCKKVAVLTNFNYLTDIMRPIGTTWADLEIFECITPSQDLAERIKEVFPTTTVSVVKPRISKQFFVADGPKPLTVNIIAKNSSDANGIINGLMWKYKQYGFVPHRELKGLPHSELAKGFQTGFLTVWIDTPTDFGYAALEAMACGNLIIGKIPENIPDWMKDKDGNIRNNGVWFYNNRDVHERIADVVETYLNDGIPQFMYDEMAATVAEYSDEKSKQDIKDKIIDGIIATRRQVYVNTIKRLDNNETEINEGNVE